MQEILQNKFDYIKIYVIILVFHIKISVILILRFETLLFS